AQNCRNDIYGRSNAPKPGDEQRESPIVGTMTRRERSSAQWGVRPPTHVRRASGAVQAASSEKAEIKKKRSQKRQPKTEGIQARKSHIARTDHQGHQVIGKSEQDGHGHKENHGRPMHGEHAVKDFRRNEIVVRMHQLNANDERLDSPHREE